MTDEIRDAHDNARAAAPRPRVFSHRPHHSSSHRRTVRQAKHNRLAPLPLGKNENEEIGNGVAPWALGKTENEVDNRLSPWALVKRGGDEMYNSLAPWALGRTGGDEMYNGFAPWRGKTGDEGISNRIAPSGLRKTRRGKAFPSAKARALALGKAQNGQIHNGFAPWTLGKRRRRVG